jgi:outer membrane receptor protein involved in Fe transport
MTSSRALTLLLLAGGMTAPIATADANDDAAAQLPFAGQDSIVVEAAGGETGVARLMAPVDQLPAAATALFGESLAAAGATTSDDALLRVPGVNVQTQSGIFGLFVIRGVDSLTGGAVLSDGVVEPEATRYPLYTVERVEVLRGPASFAWGAGSLVGALNLVRERPYFRPFGGARLRGGSFDTFGGEIDLNLGQPERAMAVRLNGLYEESEGWRPGTESRLFGAAPTLTWRLDDRSSLSLDAEFLSSDAAPDAGIPIFGSAPVVVGRKTFYGTADDYSEQDVSRFHLDYTRRIASNAILRGKAYTHRLEWESAGTVLAGPQPTPFGVFLNRLRTSLADDQRFSGIQLELLLDFDQESGRGHELSAGLEVSRRTDEFALDLGVLSPVDPLAPVDPGTGVLFPLPHLAERGDSTGDLISPWVVDRWRVAPKIEVWGGLRLDLLDYEDPVAGTANDDTELSPMLGVTWQATPAVRLWASAGQAFAPPSTRVRGDRRPETSEQIEAGARWNRGAFSAGISAFQFDRENVAIPDFTGITATTGSQRSRGLELELATTLPDSTRLGLWWTFTDAELTEFRELIQIGQLPTDFIVVDRAGNTPAFTPEHLARIEASRDLPFGLDLAIGGRWIGKQYTAESNSVEIDEAFLLDAAIGWNVSSWRALVRLSNLTDEDTYQRGQGDLAVIPAAPLAARLEISTRW